MDLDEINLALETIDSFLWPEHEPKLRNKRERILRAATDLFVRLGYRKTSMDEVAKRAGVAKGTVYLYYRNKAELVYHAASLEERTFLERMLPLSEDHLTPRDKLRSFIMLCVQITREMPLISSLIQGDHEIELALQEIDQTVVANANALQLNFVIHLLEAATSNKVPRTELEARGQVLIDLLFALTTSTLMNPQGIEWDRYANALADVVVDGVISPKTSTKTRPGVGARSRQISGSRKAAAVS